MTDIESRLRAAMLSLADQPPAGLLEGIQRRHRRYRGRQAAGCAAAVLALAVGTQPVAHALQGPVHRGQTPASQVTPRPSLSISVRLLPPIQAPTTSPLDGRPASGCASANVGSIGADWRIGARRLAGSTLWFIGAGSGHASGLTLYPGVMVINGAKPGATVIVKVTPAGRGLLRFLYGPHDSVNADTSYTMHSGENSVTFVSCPPGSGDAPEPKNATVYYGALLVKDGHCVPIDVWLPGRKSPVSTSFGDCG